MLINVKVKPASKIVCVEEIVDLLGETIFNIKLRSIPENGKANQELIEILAKHFKTNKSSVKIIKGQTSSFKIVEIIK